MNTWLIIGLATTGYVLMAAGLAIFVAALISPLKDPSDPPKVIELDSRRRPDPPDVAA